VKMHPRRQLAGDRMPGADLVHWTAQRLTLA
jgi:hypothetical protein